MTYTHRYISMPQFEELKVSNLGERLHQFWYYPGKSSISGCLELHTVPSVPFVNDRPARKNVCRFMPSNEQLVIQRVEMETDTSVLTNMTLTKVTHYRFTLHYEMLVFEFEYQGKKKNLTVTYAPYIGPNVEYPTVQLDFNRGPVTSFPFPGYGYALHSYFTKLIWRRRTKGGMVVDEKQASTV